jgi:hypothetical protein
MLRWARATTEPVGCLRRKAREEGAGEGGLLCISSIIDRRE